MSDYTNPIQNTSYTNLDFEAIYPELLDTAKLLTNKWDPSASNESDPGVVLIKEMAIISDKINYNSDKNVLETFPMSVTQDYNARALFHQLGYYMKWYRSAETKVALRWKSSLTSAGSYAIPPFTMVTDEDKTYVYTLLGMAASQDDTATQIGNIILSESSSTPVLAFAIEGIATSYSVNGETKITSDMLDSNNRLYFTTRTVAQNGIYITNYDQSNYASWERVDNLELYSLGNRYYEFNISRDGNSCYIQFPEDASEIFGDGIEITYIQSTGEDGNISARVLSQFYSDLTVNNTLLTTDNTAISNPAKSTDGYNPETIDEAYKNYKRTIGTFDTLVTLRDYNNYILNSGLVANGFVADRTADPQSSYAIAEESNGIYTRKTYTDLDASGEAVINPYTIKLYLLQREYNIEDKDTFDNTFELISDTQVEVVKEYLKYAKCLSHNYGDLLTYDADTPRANICYLKNVYPLEIRITPQYDLTTSQKTQVIREVYSALYNKLNSSKIEFGEEITTDLIEEIVLGADVKIKSVKVENINYYTYAVVKLASGSYTEYLVSEDASDKYVLLTSQPSNWTTAYYTYYKLNTSGNFEHLTTAETFATNTYFTNPTQLIREEIYAKSVLAGKTQHYINMENFDYQLGQNKVSIDYSVDTIETSTTIDLTAADITIPSNETVYLSKPNYNELNAFSDNCRVEWNLSSAFSSGVIHPLTTGEYIIFYYRQDGASDFSYVRYDGDALETLAIKPNFGALSATSFISTGLASHYPGTAGEITIGTTTSADTTVLDNVSPYSTSDKWSILADNRAISSVKKSIITLNSDTEGTKDYEYYWILDNANTSGQYQLFTAGGANSRLLGSNEYFFYTDKARTDFVRLGAGTTIELSTTSPVIDWVCDASFDLLDFVENGITALEDYWVNFNNTGEANTIFYAKENEIITIPSGTNIKISNSVTLTKTPIALPNYTVTYGGTSVTDPDLKGWIWLSLNTSSTQSQQITGNQQITCNGAALTGDFVLTDQDVNFDGDGTLQTSTTTTTGVTYLGVYNYDLNTPTTTASYTAANGVYTIAVASKTTAETFTLNTSIEAGDYILPISHSAELSQFELSLNGTVINPVGSSIIDPKKKGTYYYRFSTTGNVNIVLTWKYSANTDSIIINNIYKYVKNDTTIDIDRWLIDLDYKNKFSYTYQVDSSESISDPLKATSFLNPNHIFNAVTICKLDVDESYITL